MSSLRSSSALSYNFFAPWIGRDLGPLARALGVPIADSTIQFERKFSHGLSSTPPNIDVVLNNDQRQPLGIECKFTEPYGRKSEYHPLDAKYFVGQRVRWAEQGLPRCQDLATAIGKSITFTRLNAGQLLKHILGLVWETKQPPHLFCLWFDTGCDEAKDHRKELDLFRRHIDETVNFAEVSYQAVFARLRAEGEPIAGYHDYLVTRYFGA